MMMNNLLLELVTGKFNAIVTIKNSWQFNLFQLHAYKPFRISMTD